jgi:hypothetical protein
VWWWFILFVVQLTTLFWWLRLYIALNKRMISMNSKGLGRKRPWPNSKNYPGICLEGLRKTTNKLSVAGLLSEIWTRDLPNTKQDC